MGRPKLWGPDLLRDIETNDVEEGDLMVFLDGSVMRLAVRQGGEWILDAFARKEDTWSLAAKNADETIDDTPANETELAFSVDVNKRYAFRGKFHFDMDAGLAWGISGPAGCTVRFRRSWLRLADTADQGVAIEQAFTVTPIAIASGDGGVIEVDGTVIVGGTAGTVVPYFAASAAAEATVKAGSYMEYRRLT